MKQTASPPASPPGQAIPVPNVVPRSIYGPSCGRGDPKGSWLRRKKSEGTLSCLHRTKLTKSQTIPHIQWEGHLPYPKINQFSLNIYGPSCGRGDPKGSWFRRRKFATQAFLLSRKMAKSQAIFPDDTLLPALPHIKWQGIEQPESTGDTCYICNRGLIFAPEGPVGRPPIPPPVAVLHCGHIFHDHCLQKITPKYECKSPPCICCVID